MVENKISNISSLVKKTDYNTKKYWNWKEPFTDHNHDKYITAPGFNTLAANFFNARLAQANLITKIEFDAKLSSLNRKIIANKTKHFLMILIWVIIVVSNILMSGAVNKII